MYDTCNVNELVGKTIISIKGMEKEKDEVVFVCDDGSRYLMCHDQDCCESVWLEDVCGNVETLLNSPILKAEENTSHDNPKDKYDESHTWTFYTFATIKGYVVLRWYGTSNGYYSESVDFYRTKNGNNIEDAIKLLDEEFRHYATPDEEYAINMAIDALRERMKANETPRS